MFRYYGLNTRDYQEYVRSEQEKLEPRLKHHQAEAPRVRRNRSACALGIRGKPSAVLTEQS